MTFTPLRRCAKAWSSLSALSDAPHAVALGAAIGAFFAFLPMPGQMAAAAAVAGATRCSVAAAAAATWISNPFTAAPIYGTTYALGILLHPDANALTALILGGALAGLAASLAAYPLVRRAIGKQQKLTATA